MVNLTNFIGDYIGNWIFDYPYILGLFYFLILIIAWSTLKALFTTLINLIKGE